VLLRSVARRRKHKLKRWLPNGRSKSCNARLQPQKNLTIQQIHASEKPHTVLQKIRQSVVVLWLREVVLTLHRRLHLPHPKLLRQAANRGYQPNINSQKVSPTLVDQYTRKSRDNRFCGWLYSLIFLLSISRLGGSTRELARFAHGHGN
jgi:hypothetical protein